MIKSIDNGDNGLPKFLTVQHFRFLCFLFVAWGFLACAPQHTSMRVEPTAEEQQQAEIQKLLQQPEIITFSDVHRLVFEPACTKCHSSEKKISGVSLQTAEDVFNPTHKNIVAPTEPNESLLYQTIIATSPPRQMPPRGEKALTATQKTLVFQWIKQGAKTDPEQEPTPVATLEEQLQPYFDRPEMIDYPVIQKYVFTDGSCIQCHSPHGSTPVDDAILLGADLTDYKSLFYLNGIVPGVPYDEVKTNGDGVTNVTWGSSIYKSVAITQSMPPARRGYQPLSALRVKLLRLWILNCAIEDFSQITEDKLLNNVTGKGKIRLCE